ncbi:biotin/lipoyl-binding protein [Alcaligenaceae bacterium]|nr:biotin/lipoyl-binding protein [Alcaligenaceae bacterium]
MSARLSEMLETLEARARAAESLPELAFSIANESYGLLSFRQALVLRGDARMRLLAVSGLAKPTEDSPYLVWLRRAWAWLHPYVADKPGWFVPPMDAAMPELIQDGWREWWTQGVYVLPLRARSGQVLGWVIFLLDTPPKEWQERALTRLAGSWGYCWELLAGVSRRTWRRRLSNWKKPLRLALLGAVLVAAFLPVRQTALAPAEVVSLDARVMAAPLDGVIKTVHVRPNQLVKVGDPLFSLDDTTLRNRYEVARESVAVADAELIAATQKAFHDPASQAELALLTGRAHERRAELAAVLAQLERVRVVAGEDGIAVFGDPDDWLGRPVSTGERIMLLANPDVPGMLIHLPVADAIGLEPGASVRFFLTVRPLRPLEGSVTETSYQAVQSPDGIASYRLRAVFQEGDAGQVRIGLRGTAKLYGEQVRLGYYLLRRPLATVREWTGW